ncbi:MAG: hypothetical protein ACYCTB_11490 [bacterium]
MGSHILKAYMGSEEDTSEGACLIFAHTAKEAKKVGYNDCLRSWDINYINVRIKKLKQTEFLFSQANQKKLKSGIAHVIEEPIVCSQCETWGCDELTDGLCESCREQNEDNYIDNSASILFVKSLPLRKSK